MSVDTLLHFHYWNCVVFRGKQKKNQKNKWKIFRMVQKWEKSIHLDSKTVFSSFHTCVYIFIYSHLLWMCCLPLLYPLNMLHLLSGNLNSMSLFNVPIPPRRILSHPVIKSMFVFKTLFIRILNRVLGIKQLSIILLSRTKLYPISLKTEFWKVETISCQTLPYHHLFKCHVFFWIILYINIVYFLLYVAT